MVSRAALHTVYLTLQVTEPTQSYPQAGGSDDGMNLEEDNDRGEEEERVNPDKYFFVVDAFDMPRYHYSYEHKNFER